MPIRLGDGTDVDLKGFNAMRLGDGTVLYTGVPQGGVAYLDLDDDVNDRWNGYHGTNNGASFVDDTERGPVADFSGDSISIPNLPIDSNGQDFSISVWVKTDQNATTRNVVDNGNGDGIRWDATNEDYELVWTKADQSSTYVFERPGTLNDWYHLVIVADLADFQGDDSFLYFYVNNSQYAISNVESLLYSDTNWSLGPWSGRIDELKVFDRDLSSTEVSNLYNTGVI